jgi:hypothetical protein
MTGSDLRASGYCCHHVANIGNWSENPVPSIATLHHLLHPILIWMTRVTPAKAESFVPQF